jgi:hypothetical protein
MKICYNNNKPFFLPSVPNVTIVASQFLQEFSHSSLQSFELSLPPRGNPRLGFLFLKIFSDASHVLFVIYR